MEIRHDPDRKRFLASLEDGEAYLSYRDAGDDRLDFTRTFVPSAHRNGGIGEALVVEGFEHARSEGKRVIPTCPFVQTVVERRPEFEDLLVSPKTPPGESGRSRG